MRKSMLLALANQFSTTELSVIESWIHDHGFEPPLKLSDAENTEAARRVRKTVEKIAESDEESEDKENENEESQDEESEDEEGKDHTPDQSEDEGQDEDKLAIPIRQPPS